MRFFVLFLVVIAAGCATNGDHHRAQLRLNQRTGDGDYARDEAEAAKNAAAECPAPPKKKVARPARQWHVSIDARDPILLQYIRPSVWANYRVICADVTAGKPFHVDARGLQGSGGLIAPGIVVPRVVVLDESFQPISGAPEFLKLESGLLRTALHGRWKVTSKTSRVYLVVAPDNLDEQLEPRDPAADGEAYHAHVVTPANVRSVPYGRIDVDIVGQ